MKRNLKILVAVFLLTAIFATSNVNAATPRYWIGVTLPMLSGTETSNQASYKDITGPQYNHNSVAMDNLSGDDRAISVRTLGDQNSEWISSPIGLTVTWDSTKAKGNMNTGDYRLQVKATKSTLSTVYYTGTWYLDSTYL